MEHQDGSLAFRYCCRASICGSCAMYINGKYRLACQTNLRHVHADVITVEPMPHLPLVKDLVCDMSDFFAKYEYVKPWLIRNSQPPEREILQSPEERKKLDMPIDCILCGACYSSCPSVWTEDNYLGPAALLKAYRFEVDSRDEAGKVRMPGWDNERGVYRCHTITNCVEACPKELNPTEDALGRVELLRGRLYAVGDRVAAVGAALVVPAGHTDLPRLVARVDLEAVGLEQRRGAQVVVLGPHRRAAAVAGAAEDAVDGHVELLALLRRLQDLPLRRLGVADQPRLHVLVLGEEIAHVADQVLDQRQVRHGLHGDHVGVHVAQVGLAGEPVLAVDVHRARAADGRATTVAKGQRAVLMLLDGEEPLEDREAAVVGDDEVVVARRALRVAGGVVALDMELRFRHQYLRSCGSTTSSVTGL